MTNSARILALEKEVATLKAALSPAQPPPVLSPEKRIAQIITAITEHHGLSRSQLLAGNRRERIARIRQLAMYVSQSTSGASLQTIGAAFKRHHSTVMHACRAVESRIATEKLVAAEAHFWTTQFRAQFAAAK